MGAFPIAIPVEKFLNRPFPGTKLDMPRLAAPRGPARGAARANLPGVWLIPGCTCRRLPLIIRIIAGRSYRMFVYHSSRGAGAMQVYGVGLLVSRVVLVPVPRLSVLCFEVSLNVHAGVIRQG